MDRSALTHSLAQQQSDRQPTELEYEESDHAESDHAGLNYVRRSDGALSEPSSGRADEFDSHQLLDRLQQYFFSWQLDSDAMAWQGAAGKILQAGAPQAPASGEAYSRLVDPLQARARLATIMDTANRFAKNGAPYHVRYRLFPGGDRHAESLWIEEQGLCYAAGDLRTVEVQATIRVLQSDPCPEPLMYLSRYDALTGLMTRAYFNETLSHALRLVVKTAADIGLLMVNINNLSQINDSFGYDIGEEVIAATAHIMQDQLLLGDAIGRYTTSKFGILLFDCDKNKLIAFAHKLCKTLRANPVTTSAGAIAIEPAIGVVCLPEEQRSVEQASGYALEALEQAQSKPVEKCAFYQPSSKRDAVRLDNRHLADTVLTAVNEKRMSLFVQPIISASTIAAGAAPITGKAAISHYECLIRMQDETGTYVGAAEFMPAIERLGLARIIDHHVLQLALDTARRHPAAHLTFNISSLTACDLQWLETLADAIAEQPTLADRLTVEITETALIQDIAETASFVSELKKLGLKVAIDDFGAGYTSFRNIKLLDVDMIKIDASFVQQLVKNAEDRLFVRAMADLAKNLGMITVAEGVADKQTAAVLVDLGIDYLQGYWFGRPAPVAEYLTPAE